jgi:hypothetical protein
VVLQQVLVVVLALVVKVQHPLIRDRVEEEKVLEEQVVVVVVVQVLLS